MPKKSQRGCLFRGRQISRRVEVPRFAHGSDDSKPVWTLPAKGYYSFVYQPSIPDKHVLGAHWNYAPFTLWLRTMRPSIENVASQGWASGKGFVMRVYNPIANVVERNLPGLGFKLAGLVGLCIGYNYVMGKFWEETNDYMMLEKLQQYGLAHKLAGKGFWKSESDDIDARRQAHNLEAMRLNSTWENAIADASQTRSFATLVSALEVDAATLPSAVPKPVSWRFNMMPYGGQNDDTKTFPQPAWDSPAASNIAWLELGAHGDYINRTDNKSAPMRKARHLYATAYLPPTK